ncbi:MAG: S9 family peptidase, partial [Bdellovibrionales bacterium]|nr:S9 family peptidase [Bdellovibrionales bacterium]
NILENVKGKIYQVNFSAGKFSPPQEMSLLTNGHITLAAASTYRNDFYFSYEGFLTPESLYFYDSIADKYSMVKSLPAEFDSKDMIVKQKWAISQDGTKVPYFLVGKSSVIKDGKAPTLLYGYGGFEVSRTPFYSPTTGKLWLEKGGIYVLANIRGGGEFGPKWHQAALKENRQKAYDDFIAVGEALIDSGVTNKEKLAIMGGSNGGLLVGAVMTQRPDLFKSVVCLVPLLDMIRYSQLLAGASWMAEYGDPRDPKMREVLLSYSPYHNVSKDKTYPKLFLMTSTKDDRVHPGHARKMAAKMEEMGHKNVLYYENTEGGHAASANLQQKARMQALNFEFLFQTLF